jgi:VanZ family protein
MLICASWICLAIIAYLSLVPRSMEVRTFDFIGVEHGRSTRVLRDVLKTLEHALAYSAAAALLMKAYPGRPVWMIIAFLSTYSAVLEALQALSPGRHPSVAGVISSSLGAVAACWVASRMRSHADMNG